MLDDTLGRIHFWITFIGTYLIYLPMYYLGIRGLPRRYYAWDKAIQFIPPSAHTMNKWITVSALFVAAVQLVFLFNLVWSFFKGKPAGGNPWRATTLEWQTPDTPPPAWQLGRETTGRLPLGLRLQRARRQRGFHPAKRSTRQVGADRARALARARS